jgi:hypothetical protein
MLRQTNRIHRKAKHFNNPMHWNKFKATRKERLNNLQRGCLIIGAASFNSVGLITSGPDAFVGFITFRISSTSFSHNLISLIWFVIN